GSPAISAWATIAMDRGCDDMMGVSAPTDPTDANSMLSMTASAVSSRAGVRAWDRWNIIALWIS
ncbi:hypothetical protein, partial [Aurantimonas coralicida]|uniref:hypothetical protein n=1 Tax=Aurantimonas coralicida TaxID=182270 RepID=UPI001D17E6CC